MVAAVIWNVRPPACSAETFIYGPTIDLCEPCLASMPCVPNIEVTS